MFQGMRYVYEVYKEMSFSRAAKNLYISQPSLSTAVKKVEDRIGFQDIFDLTAGALTELPVIHKPCLSDILEADAAARQAVLRNFQSQKE